MKARVFLLLFAACEKPPAPPPPPAPITVSGRVLLTSSPMLGQMSSTTIAGLKVVLTGDYTNITSTDDAGAYRFEGVPAGAYTVQASDGDFTREGQVTTLVSAAAGATVAVPDSTLTPAGAISGRATLGSQENGNLGIRVTLDGTDLVTTTDDSGAFYLARIPVGEYRIRVDKTDFGGRTLRGIDVKFGEVTKLDTLVITAGVSADFNHPPTFQNPAIVLTPYQPAAGSNLDTLPYDLAPGQAARWDSIRLDAPASDLDNDRLTFFWSVTAGTLDHTDQDSVLWTVDDKAQQSATITVRVIDERSAAAYLTTSIGIVDAQVLSAGLYGSHAVYAYRAFSGAWRVLDYDFASGAAVRVGELDSLDDPMVDKVGDFYHATPSTNGDRRQFFWLAGSPPAERQIDGSDRGMAFGSLLAGVKDAGGRNIVVGYDPAAGMSSTLYDCAPDDCGDLAAATTTLLVSVARSPRSESVTVFGYAAMTQSMQQMAVAGPVGDRVRSDGAAIAYADVQPGFGRSMRNTILRTSFPSATSSDLYDGLYDVFLGAFDGRFIGFTEQGYRVVYSPEQAYLYDTQKSVRQDLDTAKTDWATDDVFALGNVLGTRRVLARRYPRADWLMDPPRTHYQLVTRVVGP